MTDRVLILLASARQLFEQGEREAALACFSQASKDVDSISDPQAFLFLTRKIDKLTQQHILTKV